MQQSDKQTIWRDRQHDPKLNGKIYRPGAAEFTRDGYWNGWRPSPIEPAPGDTSLFNRHMEYLFPEDKDRNHVLNWIAGVLQHPETKPRHQLFIQGLIQGSGKSFLPRLMQQLFGTSACQALTQDILNSGFTG